jgi:hypothetical protein
VKIGNVPRAAFNSTSANLSALYGSQMMKAAAGAQFWSQTLNANHDSLLVCPSCSTRPGEYHAPNCALDMEALAQGKVPPSAAALEHPGRWRGPSTPAMVLIGLVPNDARLQCSFCMRCDQPFLLDDGTVPRDVDSEHILLTRHGFGMHLKCATELAQEIVGPATIIAEEFKDRRRALLGE